MPEESSSLANNGVVVEIALPCLNGALRHIRRPIRPPTPKLSDSMPVPKENTSIHYFTLCCLPYKTKTSNMVSEQTIPMNGDIVLDMVDNFN